jgi:hypothetical protein
LRTFLHRGDGYGSIRHTGYVAGYNKAFLGQCKKGKEEGKEKALFSYYFD